MIDSSEIQRLLDDGVVNDQSGDKVGKVGQVYLDDETGAPEWVTVKTGLFGGSESFVPVRDASSSGSEVSVPFSKDQIKDAPRVDEDGHISPEQEAELYRYYGMSDGGSGDGDYDVDAPRVGEFDEGRSDTDFDDGGVDVASGGDMTRSEEQLRVGTEKVATGKARLRKYVVTENVTKTIPVQREEVRLEREPITDENRDEALAGADLTEGEAEVVLTEERVVVSKETVPVERVRLDTDTVTEQQEVNEEIRKEEIEVDLPDGQDSADYSEERDTDRL